MREWSADFTNDPNDDFNPIIEVLYDDEEVAIIKKGVDGLEMNWYPNQGNLSIPVDWLVELLVEAQKRLNK